MSGLTDEQLDELVARAEDFFEEPWDKEYYSQTIGDRSKPSWIPSGPRSGSTFLN
jgi:hypothetical protein